MRQDGRRACRRVRVPASWMGLTRDRPCSILGPCYALPVRFGISVVFVGPAVAPVAVQGRYPQHADAIYPASWTAPYSYLTGDVPGARWELAGLAGLRGHAVRLMKRRGRHGLGGSCDGQNNSNSDQPDHCHLHMNLPMTHPIARTKPMGPGLAFVHKRSAHL